MKQLKRLMSVMVAFVLALSLLVPVSAASTHTITINNDKANHTYEAYQVFAGDLTGGKLVNITWGSGVKGDELLAALKVAGDDFDQCASAADVADVLSKYGDNSEKLDAFATVVGQYLSETFSTSTETGSTYTINNLASGYYLVKDKDSSDLSADAYTKYILKVVGDVVVVAKDDVPTLDKVIVDDEDGDVDYNNVAVGDTVTYKLTSKVPAMDGYDKYYFVVNDTLSKGLTLNEDSFVVKIGDIELTNGTDYVYETVSKDDDGHSFKIVFKDFIKKQSLAGQTIEITYTAVLNDDAVIGVEGNPNNANLIYSNNPNYDYKGENEPTEDELEGNVVGETPIQTVYTYVTGIKITKVDPEGKVLAGAEFEITGKALNRVQVTKETFREPLDGETGTYYELKDGTYTTTKPTDETKSLYVSTEVTYVKENVTEWVTTSTEVKATAVSDPDGTLTFIGLSEGTYTITEIKAPDGYNLLEDPIVVTITWGAPQNGGTTCTWTTSEGTVENGLITFSVVNNAGATLPGTGGMGTTVLYVAGAALILAAGVLLVSKKKMNRE